jgi:hypothetical protein
MTAERLKFVADGLSNRFTMAEVCARHGLSRGKGYKRIARDADDGRCRLGDRRFAPPTCPYKLSTATTDRNHVRCRHTPAATVR